MIVLVTPTRDRPEAFEFCERFMDRQTLKDFVWLVVDDGDVPAKLTKGQVHLRREPSSLKGTLAQNMLAALSHPLLEKPEGQRVLIIEDDEWYHPRYVELMAGALEKSGKGFIGQSQARYYHLRHRSYHCPMNLYHASWCRTGWIHGALEQRWVRSASADSLQAGDPFIDMRVWRRRHFSAARLPVTLELLQKHSWLSVGIKGMPGRGGLGTAHAGGQRWEKDHPDGRKLAEWTSPEDRDAYLRLAL